MSALPQALPLALAAAVYPPALLVLLLLMGSSRPRWLVLAYFLGAAMVTLTSGLIALALFEDAGWTRPDSPRISGWIEVGVGVVLVGTAVWAFGHRANDPDARGERSRLAVWAGHACSSRRWAFALGGAMYLPSPLYLLAVKTIGDAGASEVLAVAVCAGAVLLFVEVPLVAMLVAPQRVTPALQHVHGWLLRNGWTAAGALALAAATYAILHGLATVT